MKKTKLLLLTAVVLSVAKVGFAQKKQVADSLQKKYSVGLGYAKGGLGRGGSLEAHYLLNKKWSVGIKLIGTKSRYSSIDYQYLDSVGNVVGGDIRTRYPGHEFNIALFSTYYIFGKNYKSRCGLFITTGLGYSYIKNSGSTAFYGSMTSYGSNTISPVRDCSWDESSTSNLFDFYASLGCDLKIWKGRLFIDLPVIPCLIGTTSYKVSNENGIASCDLYISGGSLRSGKRTESIAELFAFGDGIISNYGNIGYKIFF